MPNDRNAAMHGTDNPPRRDDSESAVNSPAGRNTSGDPHNPNDPDFNKNRPYAQSPVKKQ